MRLLTHHMMVCNVKACKDTANRDPQQGPLNFPLQIVLDEGEGALQQIETQYSKEFMQNLLPTIQWGALCKTAEELNLPALPATAPPMLKDDEEMLRKLHAILLDTRVMEGELVCGNCGRSYPIENGIPNMMLEADELH